jgi:hypothetical protein
MLEDIGRRTAIARGQLNVERFIRDSVDHREALLPLFQELKATVATAMRAQAANVAWQQGARRFVPRQGMDFRLVLVGELLRGFYLDRRREFNENDVMDFLHAAPSLYVCDMVLLDSDWCHRADGARSRLRKSGVTARVAECFSPKGVDEFLMTLASWPVVEPA